MKGLVTNFLLKVFFDSEKNDKGQVIFYPWCRPGEGLILKDAKLLKFIIICFIVLLLSFLMSIFLACTASDLDMINANMLGVSLGTIVNVHGFFYILLVVYMRKMCALHVVPESNRPRKMIFFAWILVCAQLISIRAAYAQGSLSDPFTLILLFFLIGSTVLTISLFIVIIKTRGYVFEKGGFFGS